MSLTRPSRHLARRISLVATAVVLVGGASAMAAAAADPASGPSCTEISGDLLGYTGRWEILRVGGGLDEAPLVACRRDLPGPAQVRVLGTSKGYDDGGEDSESPSGGPYVSLDAFGDGRAVLTTRTYEPKRFGGVSSGSTSVVDLDRGTSALLSNDVHADDGGGSDAKSSYHYVKAIVTPLGGLAWAAGAREGQAEEQVGSWTVWDAAGSRPAPVPAGIRDVALSLGTGGDTAGIYYRQADTLAAGRLPLSGAADLSSVPVDPAMAMQTMDLPTAKPYTGGFSYEPLDVDGKTVFGDGYLSYWPTLEYSTSSNDPKSKIRVVLDAGEERLGTLAPHSRKDLKVLTATYGEALLAGRFTTHPKQRRILAAGGSKKIRTFFDVPARRSMELPGRAVTYDRLWALADGDRLRLWIGKHGSVHRIPGLHDLAIPDRTEEGLYVTGGNGVVSYRTR